MEPEGKKHFSSCTEQVMHGTESRSCKARGPQGRSKYSLNLTAECLLVVKCLHNCSMFISAEFKEEEKI